MSEHRHLWRLEKIKGTSEAWRCVGCGDVWIDGPANRCSCVGSRLDPPPWWCTNCAYPVDTQ